MRTSTLTVVVLFAAVLGFTAGWFAAPLPERPVPAPAPTPEPPLPAPVAPEAPDVTPPSPAHPQARFSDERLWRVDVVPSDPVLGPPDALVTVVVFGDLTSVHTARALAFLQEAAPASASGLRVIWKHFPMKGNAVAERLAKLAAAAGRFGHFWKAQAWLHEHPGADPDALAAALEIPPHALDAALADPACEATVSANRAQADKLGVTATPTLFVNGRRKVGLRSLAELQALVAQEARKAQEMVRRGISPSSVYFQIMAKAPRL